MSFAAELTAIQDRFVAAWAGRTPILFSNDEPVAAPAGDFVRLTVLSGAQAQVSYGAARRFRNAGVIQIDVFVPMGSGESGARGLVDDAAAIFRGQSFAPGIVCGGASPSHSSESGGHYRMTVSINFTRDQDF